MQLDGISHVEERLLALEQAQPEAQKQAEMALTATEQLDDSDLRAQVLALHTEMTTELNKIADLQQMGVSVAALSALLTDQSKELEAVKQSISDILSSNSQLALSISSISSSITSAASQLDQHGVSVDDMSMQLQGQADDIHSLKEILSSQQASLESNGQEVLELKYVENKSTKQQMNWTWENLFHLTH